jgi:hypothetical protein
MSTLQSTFESYESRKFVFVEPGGNHGDYLIYRGAEKIAREVGIDFESVTHREFMDGNYDDETVIYLHGSGGYNPWWSGTPMQELEKASQTHKGVLIQGPSTVHLNFEFIHDYIRGPLEKTTPDKIFFYTRERTSYDALKTVLPEQVYLHTDHDTALHLGVSDLPRADVESRGHTFYAIRNDKESRAVARQRKPFRMWFDPVPYSSSFDEWVGHHARASAVVANRLHSAVVSTILGKPTVLLPNSYHKNRSVYEFSLAERGVEWREEIDTTSLDQFLSYLPARVTNSTRLASGLSKIRGLFRRKAAGSEIAGVTN